MSECELCGITILSESRTMGEICPSLKWRKIPPSKSFEILCLLSDFFSSTKENLDRIYLFVADKAFFDEVKWTMDQPFSGVPMCFLTICSSAFFCVQSVDQPSLLSLQSPQISMCPSRHVCWLRQPWVSKCNYICFVCVCKPNCSPTRPLSWRLVVCWLRGPGSCPCQCRAPRG